MIDFAADSRTTSVDKKTNEPADGFLPTRRSLLSRLRDWDDQDSWREFFETYWRLIYDVARKAGLDDGAAQDVVQETILAAARQMPGFRYDPARGSFKGWLLLLTRRRISDALRERYRHHPAVGAENQSNPPPGAPMDDCAMDSELEALWNTEWASHIATAALANVKAKANPRHYQVYDLLVVKEWPVREVSQTLGVNIAQVYLIRSRIGRALKDELIRLERSPGW
jgi:RNA polymerase sigma-70 factor (ECF subfamily)